MFVLKVCVNFLELMKECMIFFREGGREEITNHGVYMCTKHVLFERCGGKMKLQIWKQAVWQFLLNASFCRCTAAMSDQAHVFLKHLPRGPKTADYLQADPNVLCESFEPLLTDLACRLQGGRASKKKLEWSLSEAFGRSMSPTESKCFAERLLAGLEHIYNKRRQATSGAKLQPPAQRIVKAISSSSLELSPAATQGPKIDPSSLSPSQIREQYAKQLSALPEVASDIDESVLRQVSRPYVWQLAADGQSRGDACAVP